MRIAIIGATGNLGSRVMRQALDAGHEVVAVSIAAENCDPRAELLVRSLFDLTRAELDAAHVDALVSAFGSGFNADARINRTAFQKYLELTGAAGKETNELQLITIAGAGVLYADSAHTAHVFEAPGYSSRLHDISRYTSEGVDLLEASAKRHWTVVSPAGTFDPQGPLTGDVLLASNREPLVNEDGETYVSYEDLASVMVGLLGTSEHDGHVLTVASRKSPR